MRSQAWVSSYVKRCITNGETLQPHGSSLTCKLYDLWKQDTLTALQDARLKLESLATPQAAWARQFGPCAL